MRSARPAAAKLAVAYFAIGCSPTPTTIAITVTDDGSPAVAIGSIHLDVAVGSGAPIALETPPDPRLPGTVVLRFADVAEPVSVVLSAGRASSCPVRASGAGYTAPHRQVDLAIALHEPRGPLPVTCCNGARDGQETDVDCGGACDPCEVDRACQAAGDCLSSSCVGARCAPATGPPFWLPAPDLTKGRSGLGAASGTDGQIYAVGGHDGVMQLGTLEAFSQADGSWRTLTPMPTTRANVAAVGGGDGRVYAIGGYDESSGGPLDTVEAYTPGSGWATVSSISLARDYVGAALALDGRILAVGGRAKTGSLQPSARVDAYQPSAHSWATVAPLATPSPMVASTARDGRVVAIFGALAQSYDPVADRWSGAIAQPPTYRDSAAAVRGADDRVYFIGGWTSSSGGCQPLTTVDAYSPSADRWTRVADLGTGRGGVAAAAAPDGRIYAIGGGVFSGTCSGVTPLAVVEAYGPVVALTPSGGAPGSTLAITGSNFAGSARVEVFLDAAAAPSVTGATDGSGALVAPLGFVIPEAPAGAHTLRVMDRLSGYPITLAFTIAG